LRFDGDDRVPVGLGDVEEIGGAEDAGVVDQRIDRPERRGRRRQRGLHVGLAAHVAAAMDRARAAVGEASGKEGAGGLVDVPQGDRGTVTRQPLGAGSADALGGAGHHGDAAFQVEMDVWHGCRF
jgi:hypothetical protein